MSFKTYLQTSYIVKIYRKYALAFTSCKNICADCPQNELGAVILYIWKFGPAFYSVGKFSGQDAFLMDGLTAEHKIQIVGGIR